MDTAIKTRQDLIERLHRRRIDLRRLGVKRLGVFGSFRREEPHPESDVDILVEFAAGEKSFEHYMELSFLLEDELGRHVEIVTPQALSPYIGPHIKKFENP